MKTMFKTKIGPVLVVLLAILVCGLAYQGLSLKNATAEDGSQAATEDDASADDAATQTELGEGTAVGSGTTTAVTKDETIHVSLKPDGTVQKVTATEELKNPGAAATIEDASDLTDILATDEDQSFETGTDGALTWTTNGDDVTYTGTVDAASVTLPVDVKVTYLLDGVETDAAAMAGVTGDVTIRYEFTNKADVPLIVAGMVEMDDDVFSDIKVDNGKTLSGSSSTTVVGLAMPGLMDQLDLDIEDFDLDMPESFEITAHAEGFELDSAVLLVSPSLFEDINGDDLRDDMDDLDELDDDMDELADATQELVDGANSLADGADELASGATSLANGASQLSSGLSALSALPGSVKDLADANSQALAGMETLVAQLIASGNLTAEQEEGLRQYMAVLGQTDSGLSSLSDSLNDGSVGTAISAAEQLATGSSSLASGASQLASGAESLAEGLEKYDTEAIDKLIDSLTGDDSALSQLRTLPDKFDDLSAKSAAYDIFAGKAEGMESSVSFIYLIDGIEG